MAKPLKKLTITKLLGCAFRRVFFTAADANLKPSASFRISRGRIRRHLAVRVRDQLDGCESIRDGTTEWLMFEGLVTRGIIKVGIAHIRAEPKLAGYTILEICVIFGGCLRIFVFGGS